MILLRHGETKLNSEDKLRGWEDVPLNDAGIKEAKDAAKELKDIAFDRIYSSDLERAFETAKMVAKNHNLKPISRNWFRPIDYGSLAGKSLKDIQPILDDLTDKWKTDPTIKAPDGESFEDFQDRCLGGLHAVINAASDGETILIVTHLRDCLLVHGVAIHGHPLEGDEVKEMQGKGWHQDSGKSSKFEWDGSLQFKGKI